MDMNAKLTETAAARVPSSASAARIVERVFRDYRGGICVRFWDGRAVFLGDRPPRFTLVFRDPRRFRDLVLFRDPLRLAEAHFGGQVDIEGDIYEALCLKDHFRALRLSAAEKAALVPWALGLRGKLVRHAQGDPPIQPRGWRPPFFHRHSRETDWRAIAFLYDVSDKFYAL